ncbi:MAG: AAA family ATPase [Oscillospiraceae bacterium]|nr:AAA family ATPase [Oscillospiraceae bacterium]
MKMKRLSASFGALQNKRLTLDSGLNIIQGPNERGKSTWCAFIRAMLYGINTAERKSDGFLPEKAKYQPWSGQAMEGIMEVETEDGRAIAIQRTALGPYPMKRLDVRYSGTGEEVIALMHENLGETLTGVPEAVFVRSAFIRQAGLKVAQTGQLEQRIAALVSSGEEGLSYRDTASILGTWHRKRRHNKSGQIPTLEAELAALDQTLARLQDASVAYNEVSLDLDRAMARAKELRTEQAAHVELERRKARQNIFDARDKLQALDIELDVLRKQAAPEGKEVSRERIDAAKVGYDKLSGLSMRYNEAKSEKESAQRDLELIHEEKKDTSFAGRPLDEAKEMAEQAEKASIEADETSAFNRQKYTIPLAILPVAALASLAAALVGDFPAIPFWPVPALGVFGLALFGEAFIGAKLFRRWRIAKDAEKRRGEAFVRFRVSNIEDLMTELEDYRMLCGKAGERENVLREAEFACEAVKAEMQTVKEEFEREVKTFAPDVEDIAAARTALMEMSKVIDRLDAANTERVSAAHLYKTLAAGYDGDPTEPIPDDGLEIPLRTKSETVYELKRTEKDLDLIKSSYGVALGEVRALGDPLILGAKRGIMESRLKDLTLQHEALGLAMEVLAEADSEITARFSPMLGQRAGHYLDKLTGGQYKRVVFDKNLTPSAERAGESVARDILYLSGGTVDQIYLALRLAICDLTFPAEKACPIILDDALVSFDEGRMRDALSLLQDIAAERQVILFTCHDREAKCAAGKGAAHIVEL